MRILGLFGLTHVAVLLTRSVQVSGQGIPQRGGGSDGRGAVGFYRPPVFDLSQYAIYYADEYHHVPFNNTFHERVSNQQPIAGGGVRQWVSAQFSWVSSFFVTQSTATDPQQQQQPPPDTQSQQQEQKQLNSSTNPSIYRRRNSTCLQNLD